ncbi:MAG: transposase [Candidatus Acidiferrum sp.]
MSDATLLGSFQELLRVVAAQMRELQAAITLLIAADPLWQKLDQAFRSIKSYLGLIPREHRSGGHQRLGSISKQGTLSCTCCWWKQRRSRCVTIRNFATSICTVVITWPRWRRPRKLAIRLY